MGLDIHVLSDAAEHEETEHALSRDFCTLMCRRDAIEEEPELDQIGRLTGVGIEAFYRMEEPDEALLGNIDGVIATVDALLVRLSPMRDLPQRLGRSQNIRLVDRYFANFDDDPGDGYIGNNFGQDLRNLRRHLAQLKAHGATMVYFEYA